MKIIIIIIIIIVFLWTCVLYVKNNAYNILYLMIITLCLE